MSAQTARPVVFDLDGTLILGDTARELLARPLGRLGGDVRHPYDEDHDLMKLIRNAGRHHEAGDDAAARAVYREVWGSAEERGDAFHACLAAHMLGVMESSLEEKLRWHVDSLDRAQRVGGERVAGFYPSLYANVGSVYRQLGRRDEAVAYYRQAQQHAHVLHDDAYGNSLKADIATGLAELGAGDQEA